MKRSACSSPSPLATRMSPSPGGALRPPDVATFTSLIASLPKQENHAPPKFVKKLDKILSIQIQGSSRTLALKFVDHALIDQFTGIWSLPRAMAIWIDKNWKSLLLFCFIVVKHCSIHLFVFMLYLENRQLVQFPRKFELFLIFSNTFLGIRGLQFEQSWISAIGVSTSCGYPRVSLRNPTNVKIHDY